MRFRCALYLAVAMACFSTPVPASTLPEAQDHPLMNLSLGLGLEYETGDYGTGTDSDLWTVPLLVEWAPHERFSLSLEIPFVSQTTAGDTVLVGGTPTPMRGRRLNGMATTTASVTTGERTESGLGDVTLNAGVTLLEQGETAPRLLGLLYAKLPTADEQKGLGTGEFDWGGGLGLGRRFSGWSGYVEVLYIEPGTSTLYAPDPYLEWLASVSFRASETLRPGLALSGGTAPFDGQDDPLEIKLRLSGLAGEHGSYSLYLAHGLSDASPDWGFGLVGYLDY